MHKKKPLTYYTEKSKETKKKMWRSQCKIPNLRKVHLHSERHKSCRSFEENILTDGCTVKISFFFVNDCHLEGNSNMKIFTNLPKKEKHLKDIYI